MPASTASLQVDVGRAYDPHAPNPLFPAADSRVRAVLQKSKQLALQVQMHVADLVKKQRAAVSNFNQTRPSSRRSGKGPLFVAKELTFKQDWPGPRRSSASQTARRCRLERVWRNLAMISLPVPLSP